MESSDNSENKKRDLEKRLFKIFKEEPLSRRMAITLAGKDDQTYYATKPVYKWLKSGRAQIVGKFKCKRSGHLVEYVTTDPEKFVTDTTQYKMSFFE